MADALELTCELIRRRSLTPDDAGCQDLISKRLAAAGFLIECLPSGDVSNLWAAHGHGHPVMVLLGHTDVVPTGPIEQWMTDPFDAVIKDGVLYGRGAADMKSGLAVMVETAIEFVLQHPEHPGTLALLITSDEEGKAQDGTRHVVEVLAKRGLDIDYCLVGEASSFEKAGDEVRIGRRGSLSGNLSIIGTQGHVAYPDRADNAAHRLLSALAEMIAMDWPEGDKHFPPLSLQVSNVASGTGAPNLVPGHATAYFNFRYPPPIEPGDLKTRVEEVIAHHAHNYSITWRDSGRPFLSPAGQLREAVKMAVEAELGITPTLSTGGGTSDARFIAPMGAEVIELGPPRESIHKVNEHIHLSDLERLSRLYARILESTLVSINPLRGSLPRSNLKINSS